MKALIKAMMEALRSGESVMLCSILQSDGSTPRATGAKMAVFADGTGIGTVGGGAVERLTQQRASDLLRVQRSGTYHYQLHPNQTEDIGMVCGGDVLIGFLLLTSADLQTLAQLEAIYTSHETAWLQQLFPVEGAASMQILRENIHTEQTQLKKHPVLTEDAAGIVFTEPLQVSEQVYLFGGGHVGFALVPALSAAGFTVTVYDEREAFAMQDRFPAAAQTICAPYTEVLRHVDICPEDYAVVMTPGHVADYEVLAQLLKTDATYIGCIGSRKKVAFVNQRLRNDGFIEEQIARIHAPIGLPILAQTPEEIAVSITAQMIYHRHGGR